VETVLASRLRTQRRCRRAEVTYNTPIGTESKEVATSTTHSFETGCRRAVNSTEAIGSTTTSECYLETI
jgi:hypothetical protein